MRTIKKSRLFPSLSDRAQLLRVTLKIVSGARRILDDKLAHGLRTWLKPDKTVVTDADKAVERYLRWEIRRLFPDHGIIGEEFGSISPDSPFQWIIDPIDGTLSFTRGIPLYGIIVALHHQGRPVLGVIDHPALRESYYAATGLGAFRNGRPIRIRDVPESLPGGEIIATGDGVHFARMGAEVFFDRLISRHPQVRSYADCFGHTLAARGAVGAMVDFGVKIWDIAATEVLISEAGGRYVVARRSQKPDGTLYGIVFGKPRVVDWVLKQLDHEHHR